MINEHLQTFKYRHGRIGPDGSIPQRAEFAPGLASRGKPISRKSIGGGSARRVSRHRAHPSTDTPGSDVAPFCCTIVCTFARSKFRVSGGPPGASTRKAAGRDEASRRTRAALATRGQMTGKKKKLTEPLTAEVRWWRRRTQAPRAARRHGLPAASAKSRHGSIAWRFRASPDPISTAANEYRAASQEYDQEQDDQEHDADRDDDLDMPLIPRSTANRIITTTTALTASP